VFVFAVQSPWIVLGALLLLLLAFAVSGLRGTLYRPSSIPARLSVTMALLLGLLQLLFVRQGRTLFRLGPFAPTVGGVEAAVYVAGRFLSVVLLSYLFVLTTEPNKLTYALMQAGLPYRYGFALVTALRLVPVFEQEGQIVYNAQLARGVRYDVRSPRRFLTLARQFFFPLLVSALGKVDALAVSMEGRCFGKYPRRTFLRQVPFKRLDGLALAMLLAAAAGTGVGLVLS
jgi:energy-coupling factor transport system permease protein